MELKLITTNDEEWEDAIEYAQTCPWKAGKSLVKKMTSGYFNDWQRVMIVKDDVVNKIKKQHHHNKERK